jgi:hypothetical protein
MPELAKGLYRQMMGYKHRNLLGAYWALLAGFVPLVVAILPETLGWAGLKAFFITRLFRKK